ncbi:MAG: DUF6046 domain-containing protein [Candidatus Methylacidiphilales bacterium]
MIDFRNDVGTLFELAFGVKMPLFIPVPLQVKRPNNVSFKNEGELSEPNSIKYNSVEVSKPTTSVRKSHFGLPVYSSIMFKGGSYKKFNRFGVLENVEMKDFPLPATTLVDFSRNKILPETQQNASEGATIEMYGFENWSVRIRLLCLADKAHPTAKTAEEQKLELLRWEDLADSINVVGQIFTEKDIYSIVIKSISVSQLEGRPNAVPIELQCIAVLSSEQEGVLI